MSRQIPCRNCKGLGTVVAPDYITTPPRIVSSQSVLGGVPRIDGTRIPVAQIQVLAEARGLTVADIEWLFPELTAEHIRVALDHVAPTPTPETERELT